MSLFTAIAGAAIAGEKLLPKTKRSLRYKNWISVNDLKRCLSCEKNHGKVFEMKELPNPKPPLHFFCRCTINPMDAIKVGTATICGLDGADWVIKHTGRLPVNYISKEEAVQYGWRPGKCLSSFAPDKIITGGRYFNDDGHLPSAEGRIWYEADINYISGKRNSQRILWSNDGLMLATYDHYKSFYEVF